MEPLPAEPSRVLLVRLGAVGDVVRVLPLLQALRRAHPGAFLGWAVEPPSAGLLQEVPGLDAVHVLPRKRLANSASRPWRWPLAIGELSRFVRGMRARRYDLVLDVHGTLKAALVARLSGARRVVGLARGGSKEGAWLLYDQAHTFPSVKMSRIRRAFVLARAEGLLDETAPTGDDADPQIDHGLRFAPERGQRCQAFAAAAGRPLVVLFPFASGTRKGQRKRWPLASWIELGEKLGAQRARPVLAWGSPDEGREAETALRGARSVELAPRTDLVELSFLLRSADLLITGDTGPMHLGAAVGCPVLALFGPSDAVINRPWGAGHRVIQRMPLASLSVDEVHEAAMAMLRDRGLVQPPA